MMGITMSTEEEWICNKCTLRNTGDNNKCKVCGQQRQRKSTNWICRTCDLENPSTNTCCSACGKKRIQGNNQSALNGIFNVFSRRSDKNWNCAKCTLENPSSQAKCAACGNPKEVIVIPDSHEDQQDMPGQSSRSNRPDKDSLAQRKGLYPNLKLEMPKIELDPDIAQQSPAELMVRCPECQTSFYDNAELYCSVCKARCKDEGFKPRPFPSSSIATTLESSPPPLPGQWNCPGCTFANQNSQDKCEICGTDKDKSSTAIESAKIVSRGIRPSTITDPEPSTSGLSSTSSSGKWF